MRRLTIEGVEAFRRCPRKYHIEGRLGYGPREGRHESVSAVVRRFASELWRTRKLAPVGRVGPTGDPYDDARAAALAGAYGAHYAGAALDIKDTNVPFGSPIVNPLTGGTTQTFHLAGLAPALADIDGGLWAVDLRVTSSDLSPGGTLWQRVRLGTRTLGFVLGLRGSGIKVRGVCVELLRRPELRPKLATPEDQRRYVTDRTTKALRLDARQRETDESPNDFAGRLFDDIAERPDRYVTRALFEWTERELEEAKYDLWASARSIRENELADRWPRNPESCEERGRLCPYFDVCRGVNTLGDTTRFEKKEPLTDAHDEP